MTLAAPRLSLWCKDCDRKMAQKGTQVENLCYERRARGYPCPESRRC
jgi:hypothetical protein